MIVVDTHVLIWWVSGSEPLSVDAQAAIAAECDASDGEIIFSAITAWEIAMLERRGRLVLSMELDEWMATVKSIDPVRMAPLSDQVAIQSTRLPGEFHKDPADRFIVALARQLNVPLLTADRKIRDYPHVHTIWK